MDTGSLLLLGQSRRQCPCSHPASAHSSLPGLASGPKVLGRGLEIPMSQDRAAMRRPEGAKFGSTRAGSEGLGKRPRHKRCESRGTESRNSQTPAGYEWDLSSPVLAKNLEPHRPLGRQNEATN